MSELVTVKEVGISTESQEFELVQRKAKAYAASNLVPDQFKNNMSNCIIAMEMAKRMEMNALMLMQNMYIVHGKPSFSSTFVIACINACGRFTPLRFKYSGEGDNRKCIAYCHDKKSGDLLESTPITIQIAKAEGWYGKKGSKWQTMPDLMLQYRAATFFGRAFAPDYLMGLHTREEMHDIHSNKVHNEQLKTVNDYITDEENKEPVEDTNDLNDECTDEVLCCP